MQQSGPSMAAMVGPVGPTMATKFAVDGPGGPVMAGDHLRRDRSREVLLSQFKCQISGRAAYYYCNFYYNKAMTKNYMSVDSRRVTLQDRIVVKALKY